MIKLSEEYTKITHKKLIFCKVATSCNKRQVDSNEPVDE